MKKCTLMMLAMAMVFPLFAQLNATKTPNGKVAVPMIQRNADGTVTGTQTPNPLVTNPLKFADYATMTTVYDLQSNSSAQNRLYYYADGTLGATGMMAHETSFTDRGTGYNFFDGSDWDPVPAQRIESVKTGWPSYAPCGPAGEIVVAHQSGTTPLIISKRETKGTGAWTQTELYPPAGASGMLWPRMVTSGPDNLSVHVICLTAPTANGGTVWNDLDGALVYNRSLDGGTTWDGWELLDGMTSSEFLAFSADSYCWAEPKGDVLAFTSGDNWYDQFIMKSTDNGDTWTKITVWPCPFTFWAGGDTTGNFYCADGTNSLVIDGDDNVHLAFGLQRANGDEAGDKFWFPFTDGIVYWNEGMDPLPEFMDWDQLYADGYLIGWVSDTNTFYVTAEELAYYFCSMTSHPNLVFDEAGDLYCIWDEVTILKDINNYMLRHLYGKASFDGGEIWTEESVHVSNDFIYTWSEFSYPFVAKNSTIDLYLVAQEDGEAGTYFYGSQGFQGQVAITQNNILAMTVYKGLFFPQGIDTPVSTPAIIASLSPNPADHSTTLSINLRAAASLSVSLATITGSRVLHTDKGTLSAGNHLFTIDVSHLASGLYFCTMQVNGEKITQKLMVR